MAVYKSTYCSPLLESVDPRVVAVAPETPKPCIWLKCKINSSNKKITGYQIRILDQSNNVIFPNVSNPKISPISELPQNLGDSINSGLNGTMLYIPFFQNFSDPVTLSYNALYYMPRYQAEHLLQNPDADWVYDSANSSWENVGAWDHKLNGEQLIAGETIFVVDAPAGNGLYTLDLEGKLVPYQDFDTIPLVESNATGYARLHGNNGSSPEGDPRVVIIHGDVHDTVFYWYNNAWTDTDRLAHKFWKTKYNNDSIQIDIENGSYKWELTLYQGDGAIEASGTPNLVSISYANLAYDWYDMMLTSGTILGSTNKRIQIAGSDGTLPSGSPTDPLVLQGRYVQLLDSNSGQIANRAYVSSYDASFGHVYPSTDAFQLDWVNAATKVCFYKHGNSEEGVLPGEQVRLATTENIELYVNEYTKLSNQAEAETAASVDNCFTFTQTQYTNQNSYTYTKVDSAFVTNNPTGVSGARSLTMHDYIWFKNPEGQTTWTESFELYNAEGFPSDISSHITVTGMDVRWTFTITSVVPQNQARTIIKVTGTVNNGISGSDNAGFWINGSWTSEWVYYTYGAATFNTNLGLIPIDGYMVKDGDVILVKDQLNAQENGVYIAHTTAWERIGSYKTWGKFIGAILYVREGIKNNATNWESLATPYGTLLDVTSATSGNSPLYFKIETPIPLFMEQISATVDLFGNMQVAGGQSTQMNVDGVEVAVGHTIYDPEVNKIYIVDQVTETTITLHESVETVSAGDYIFVTSGAVYGNSVMKITLEDSVYNASITTDLSEAYILKNSTTTTYISPFTGMKSNMAIKLLNNKYVAFASDPSELTHWIKINSVNNVLWCITHDALTTPLKSADLSDSSVPYKYELRSYFKSSDENPFSCYEAPYLKLDLQQFTGLDPYQVIDPGLLEYVDYLVDDSTYYIIIPGEETINDRKITLNGLYFQHQQMSWESYRWVLLDHNGNIIQDTGVRYDRDMTVTFYGLEDEEHYAAILYVTDDANNNLTLVLYFGVDLEVEPVLAGTDFTAEFDCSTHSVLLTFENYNFTAPSYDILGTSLKYVADNAENLPASLGIYWDNSYSLIGDKMYIHDTINQDDSTQMYPVPLIDIYEYDDSAAYTGLSTAVRAGINYEHTFPYGVLAVPSDDNWLEVDSNEFYFETKLRLTPNYCGKFLSFIIADENNNQVEVELSIPENFNDSSNPTVGSYDSNRNLVAVRVNEAEDYLYNGANYFNNFSLSSIIEKFALQHPASAPFVDENKEYHIFKSSVNGETVSLWYKKQEGSGNEVYYLNSSYDLGNLGLVKNGHLPGPMYWSENRGTIFYLYSNEHSMLFNSKYKDGGDLSEVFGINLTSSVVAPGSLISDPEYMPSWPTSETDMYWREGGIQDNGYQSVFWDDVTGHPSSWGQPYLSRYIVRPRHPISEMSDKEWTVIIKCPDFETLFTNVNQLTFWGDTNNQYTTHAGVSSPTSLLDIILIPDE